VTTPPNFPVLPGQGWSVHKKPSFSTRVASHVSGREVRAPFYSNTLYEFELTFDGLASNAAYPGLGTNSLQSLMGLYLQVQGQFGTFLYTDPTDNSATAQAIGTGNNGYAYTFQRTLGGVTEPVSWVTAVANIYLNGINQPGILWSLSTPNTLFFVPPLLVAPAAAYLLAETSATGVHTTSQAVASQPSGTPITFTCYVQAALRSAAFLQISNGGTNPSIDIDIAGVTVTPHGSPTAASIASIGGGWYQVSISAAMAATGVPTFLIGIENPAGTSSYAGTAGDGICFSGASWGIGGAPVTQLPAFATTTNATVATAAIALPGPVAITATFAYAFNCRFLDDQADFENFMNGLWMVSGLKFRSVKP
jgi:hypothetical protein